MRRDSKQDFHHTGVSAFLRCKNYTGLLASLPPHLELKEAIPDGIQRVQGLAEGHSLEGSVGAALGNDTPLPNAEEDVQVF